MLHRKSFPTIVVLLTIFSSSFAWADAQQDLADGRAALVRGDFEKAAELLVSAAEALPASVEAQLHLAECRLKRGELKLALERYLRVLRLSPDHSQAKGIVAALRGRDASWKDRLASARTLIDVAAHSQAESMLALLMREPMTRKQRNATRLMLAEARLWSNNFHGAVTEALQVVQESDDGAVTGPARIVVALGLLQQPEKHFERAADLVTNAGNVPAPWKGRAEFVGLLIDLQDASKAADISRRLAGPLSNLPDGKFRRDVVKQVFDRLLNEAKTQISRGNRDVALAIVWQMIAAQPIPKADSVLKPLEISGGWLGVDQLSLSGCTRIGRVFSDVAAAEFRESSNQASLLGFWLASELYRQCPARETEKHSMATAAELATYSRTNPGRRPGSPLSAADNIQRTVLLQLASQLKTTAQQNDLVKLIVGQLGRYAAAQDLETGLSLFVHKERLADNEQPPFRVRFVDDLNQLPPGTAHRQLLQTCAQHYATLGQQTFQTATNSLLRTANNKINDSDTIALILNGQIVRLYATDKSVHDRANQIVERYATAAKWLAAEQATQTLFALQSGDAGQWAIVRLKIRQATTHEDRLLATNRQLSKQLSDLIQEALNGAVKVMANAPTEQNRNATIFFGNQLINRYGQLNRVDLCRAVIKTISQEKSLADWSLWTETTLLNREANQALAQAARQFKGGETLTLHEHHQTEIAALGQLITQHPESAYLSRVVGRVSRISQTYLNYQSYDTARLVLVEFTKAHPNLSATEQLEYGAIQVALGKAHTKFGQRQDQSTIPAAISEEYKAVIDELAQFLKVHPTGAYSSGAEDTLFAIARVYGQAGAWPVTREILDVVAAAIPDFRAPSHLKLLRAATFLGELDKQYGLTLLTPAPKVKSKPVSAPFISSLAMLNSSPLDLDATLAIPGFKYDAAKKPASGKPRRTRATASDSSVGGGGEGGGGFAAGGVAAEVADGNIFRPAGNKNSPGTYSDPNQTALAMIRQSQQRQFQKLAMLETSQAKGGGQEGKVQQQSGQSIALPSGPVLSEVELKRQDDAANNAYSILIKLANGKTPSDVSIAVTSRSQILWLFGFFEGQGRADRANEMITRLLVDRPTDLAKLALSYRILTNMLDWSRQRQPTDRINLTFVNQRHERYELSREEIASFIANFATEITWVDRARMLVASSYEQESVLAASLSPVRAGGLLVRSARSLLELLDSDRTHPDSPTFPTRLWKIADRLGALRQNDQAVYVLNQIPIRFPTNALANQSVLRVADLDAAGLSNPLRAVETYQEYLSLNGDNQPVRTKILAIAQQLAGQMRYLEALHVYGIFVDSFPIDPRAADALKAIGQIHQLNEAWLEAIDAYDRVLDEYPNGKVIAATKLSIAECQISLSQWRAARNRYEEFIQEYPKHASVATAKTRQSILKTIDRYQSLIEDNEVLRNKDDAQFQIARIVLEQLKKPVKAVEEFRKVVANYPKSDVADDAQLAIGKALLSLNRLDDGRAELLKVPSLFPNSPVADDALFLIGQSFEQQAQRLMTVTTEKALLDQIRMSQREVYEAFNKKLKTETRRVQKVRDDLKKQGKDRDIALNEAASATRFRGAFGDNITNYARNAELQTEKETALQVANRQDRLNDAYREAVEVYLKAAGDYPLGDRTDDALLRVAQILETKLRDRAAAISTYQQVVKLFPGTPVAEDAAWKVAQFYEQERKFTLAASAYRVFIRNYPASSRVADAQFAMAEVLEELGQWIAAMDAYEVFRQKFNKHPKAITAVEQINWIKTYRK